MTDMASDAFDPRLLAGRHEQGLARFLQPRRRERFVSGLRAGGASREKVLRRLPHFTDLDARYGRPAPSGAGWEDVTLVARAMVDLGAPPTAYVVSELASVDGRFMPLEDALRGVLSQDSGSLVSCVPGALALFEGETPGDRYLLVRDVGG